MLYLTYLYKNEKFKVSRLLEVQYSKQIKKIAQSQRHLRSFLCGTLRGAGNQEHILVTQIL